MQFLVLTERNLTDFTLEDFTPELQEEESQQVRRFFADGHLRQIWRRGDMPGACMLWEGASEEDVRTKIEKLPLAQRGMLKFVVVTQLIPYGGFGPR